MNGRAPKAAAGIFPVFLHFPLALHFDPRVRAENIWLVQQHQPRRFPATHVQPTQQRRRGRGRTPLQEFAASRKRASRRLPAPHPLPPPPTDDKWSASPKREKAMPASCLPIQPPTARQRRFTHRSGRTKSPPSLNEGRRGTVNTTRRKKRPFVLGRAPTPTSPPAHVRFLFGDSFFYSWLVKGGRFLP